jgi:DNA polymerase-3 subunit epsilon
MRRYSAIDFETACPASASACSVGVVRLRGGAPAETFYSLIKPPEGMDILPFFTRIHGIRQRDVADAPTFEELWPSLRDFLDGDELLAHNAPFDRGVLRAALAYYSLGVSCPRFTCTVRLARAAWPLLPNHKLDTVCAHLDIGLDHHNALSDAQACARIYLAAQAAKASAAAPAGPERP